MLVLYYSASFNIPDCGDTLDFLEDPRSPAYYALNIPKPPPPPRKICSKSITHRGRVQSKNGIRCIKIPGVPHGAVSIVIRFLYSACYEEREMKKFVLHLLVLSHSYSVPSLKRVFIHFLEHDWLSPENVIDVLQLGRNCDAPQLIVFCIRMIVRNFKTISTSEGWKVMRCANPMLEQELLKSVVEADSVRQKLVNACCFRECCILPIS
ncbi:hypothetical protein HAX54_012033 [Datura stramonium]|uniref:Uncharacterized protein n=1 Tax=Datura stramonium TaxID=4076 RepID=A0ABS8Y2G0_DATST|nr:hypothetical protein [Datura stramonium]